MNNMIHTAETFIKNVYGQDTMTNRYVNEDSNESCIIGFLHSNKNKDLIVVTALEASSVNKENAEKIIEDIGNDKFFIGKFEIDFDDENKGVVYVKYTRKIASCFGIKNKEKNYQNLLSETIDEFFSKVRKITN